MAFCEDFRFPETQGRKPLGTALMNGYVGMVQQATHHDPVVYGAFIEVLNLLAPPSRLFRPQILWRVWRSWRRRQRAAAGHRSFLPRETPHPCCPADHAVR